MKYQNLLQSVARFLASQPIKIFTQLLVSVSLFSFLFSYSSSYNYLSFLTHSLKFSYSAFPFQLVSRATDKNYVFFICNGIFLLLLAKTSGEEKEKEKEEEEEEEENGFLNELQLEAEPLCNTSNEHVIDEDKKVMIQPSTSLNVAKSNLAVVEYNKKEATSKEESGFGGEECCASTTYNIVEADFNNYEENEMGSHENGFLMEEEEEEGGGNDEALSKLSTEELNKKFEEFIRRMKEEIRIEARQHLILVK